MDFGAAAPKQVWGGRDLGGPIGPRSDGAPTQEGATPSHKGDDPETFSFEPLSAVNKKKTRNDLIDQEVQ